MKEQIQRTFADKIIEKASALGKRLAESPNQIVAIVNSSGGAPFAPSSRLFARYVIEGAEHALGVRLIVHEFEDHDGDGVLAVSIDPRDLEPARLMSPTLEATTDTPPADGNDYPDAA